MDIRFVFGKPFVEDIFAMEKKTRLTDLYKHAVVVSRFHRGYLSLFRYLNIIPRPEITAVGLFTDHGTINFT